MALCHGPIDRVGAIFVDNKVAWTGEGTEGTITIDAPELFGGTSREGGISGDVDLSFGGPDQNRNTYLQSQLGDAIPAFRGVVSAILKQVYMGTNYYLKPWSFQAQRIHVRQDGIPQWYDAKSEILSGAGNVQRVVLEELFNEGLAPYEVVDLMFPGVNAGSFQDYAIVQDDFGPALQILPVTPPFPKHPAISRPLGRTAPLQRLTGRFKLITLGDDDNGIIELRDADLNHVASLGVARDIDVDAAQRPVFTIDNTPQHAIFMGTQTVDINIWYRFEIQYNAEARTFAVSIHNYATDELFGSGLFNLNNSLRRPVSFLFFTNDDTKGDSGSCVFDNIVVGASDSLPDMNPAHIIRECLTDPVWGLNYIDGDIDEASFTSAADTLFNEGMGISITWDRQMPIEDFIVEILQHIDATLYVDTETGRFTLTLIRDDYVTSELTTYDESDISELTNYSRSSFADLTNSLTVNYWDNTLSVQASVTVEDPALIQTQGSVINTTVQYPGFTNFDIASRIAKRDLIGLSTPLISCTVTFSNAARNLKIGSVFILNWPLYQIEGVVMRVTTLSYGDGVRNIVRANCVQDVFGIPTDSGLIASTESFTPFQDTPLAAEDRLVIEAPYYELVVSVGQTEVDARINDDTELGYLIVGAGQAGDSLAASFWTDDGAGFEQSGPLDFSPSLTIANEMYYTDTSITYSSSNSIQFVDVGSYGFINGEFVRIDSIDTATSTVVIGRGLFDTIPKIHTAGSVLLFSEDYTEADNTEYATGEAVSVKIATVNSRGVLNIEAAPTDIVNMNSRAIRPYIPGNLRFNGDYYPRSLSSIILSVEWSHRDRLQQTSGVPQDFLDGNIGPESGTTYNITVDNESGTEVVNQTGLTGTSFTYTNEEVDLGAVIPGRSGIFQSGEPLSPLSFAQIINNHNPVLYLRFDEVSGTTAVDSSPVGNNGTYMGNPTFGEPALTAEGTSVRLDGSGDAVNVPHVSIYNSPSQTILGIIQPPASTPAPNIHGIIFKAPTTGFDREINCSINSSGELICGFWDGTSLTVSLAGTVVTDNNPHFFAAVKEFRPSGDFFALYIDGVLVDSILSTFNARQNTEQITIGRLSSSSTANRFYNGVVDEFAIINSALTSSQISSLNSARLTPTGTGSLPFRLNSELVVRLSAHRDTFESFNVYNLTLNRNGYGYRYGQSYGGA